METLIESRNRMKRKLSRTIFIMYGLENWKLYLHKQYATRQEKTIVTNG